MILDNNAISFQEYLEKKYGKGANRDILSGVLTKDLREQADFINWYLLHNNINKHKLFVHALFHENHSVQYKNPNSGYVIYYSDEHLESSSNDIVKALEWMGRDYILIDAANKTFKQLEEYLLPFHSRTKYEVFKEFENMLLNSDKVLILKNISKLKGSKDAKIKNARSFIKVLDDAHFKNITPKADIIFIDTARFLEDAWDNIGIYLNILG
ncbi:MAG: hypothetical protein JJT76_13040 [Clostridiaceae bacterium]|nr:hypothetical protein [Clostridiaceae bacterium]